MSIMVTGGTGFIGARIIRKLVEQGQEVVCFDLAPPRPNLQPYMDRISFFRGDTTQMTHLLEAVHTHQVHRIIHMAALLPPDTEERPQYGMYVNIHGTNNVFEVARWTGLERVVYASSIAVYGVQETFGQRPVNEEDISNPANVYGMTKAANDFSARRYIQRFGLDLRGVRICTVFGHGPYHRHDGPDRRPAYVPARRGEAGRGPLRPRRAFAHDLCGGRPPRSSSAQH